MAAIIRSFLSWPPIAHLPITVRRGVAEGARWSFFPWTAYWRGTHEPEIQAKILHLFTDWTGKHVWDLGSHYGLYAIGLARRVGPTGSVAAFEPNPHSFARLQLHVKRNRLGNMSIHQEAVSNHTGSSRFFLYEGMETTTSHLAYDDETWNESIPTMQVSTVVLDNLVAAGRIQPPDFIKVDVEGHGAKALAGAVTVLRKKRPVLLAGFHSQEEIEGILAILNPLNYRVSPATSDAPRSPTVGFDYIFEPVN